MSRISNVRHTCSATLHLPTAQQESIGSPSKVHGRASLAGRTGCHGMG
jgi:hypothetical protein